MPQQIEASPNSPLQRFNDLWMEYSAQFPPSEVPQPRPKFPAYFLFKAFSGGWEAMGEDAVDTLALARNLNSLVAPAVATLLEPIDRVPGQVRTTAALILSAATDPALPIEVVTAAHTLQAYPPPSLIQEVSRALSADGPSVLSCDGHPVLIINQALKHRGDMAKELFVYLSDTELLSLASHTAPVVGCSQLGGMFTWMTPELIEAVGLDHIRFILQNGTPGRSFLVIQKDCEKDHEPSEYVQAVAGGDNQAFLEFLPGRASALFDM